MTKRLLIFAVFSIPVAAQTPVQFANLPTDTNDYTCGGIVPCSTWAMPAQPVPGASVTDPIYETKAYRLSDPSMPIYSRVQSWNSTQTRMLVAEVGTVYDDLYDATTTPPTKINRIMLADNTILDGVDNDANWAFTDANRIYFTSASNTVHGLELRYVDVSTCTPTSCVLTPVLIHAFSCTTDATSSLGAGIAGNKIETGSGAQGGMFDNTDTYFSFTCDKVAGDGRHEIDFIRYNRTTDSVTAQTKWYNLCPGQTPSGCKAYIALGKDANLTRINQHPDQRFITVIWQTTTALCPAKDSSWVRSCGTEVFDPAFNFLGPASPSNTHQDVGFDVSGHPVWVGAGYETGGTTDYREFAITDLTKLDPTKIVSTHIVLPTTFSYIGTTFVGYQKPWHISMQADQTPGWALLSTFMYSGQSLALSAKLPIATTLGTAVVAGVATVTPASMSTVGTGVLSMIDFGNAANAEMVTWTATTGTTATATFAKPHTATAPVQSVSADNTGWGAGELWAMKIDASAPDLSDAIFYRIGRTHAVRDSNYNCEAHATVNRDFTQILWGSSWDQDCNTNAQVTGYWMPLAVPSWKLNVSCTIMPGNPPTITNCVGVAQ